MYEKPHLHQRNGKDVFVHYSNRLYHIKTIKRKTRNKKYLYTKTLKKDRLCELGNERKNANMSLRNVSEEIKMNKKKRKKNFKNYDIDKHQTIKVKQP